MMKISVIGAGTMGAGIAQIAATNGHEVCLYDSFDGAIESAESKLKKILNRLVEKERITQQENEEILERINFTKEIKEVSGSGLVIEAIIENLEIKQKVFTEIVIAQTFFCEQAQSQHEVLHNAKGSYKYIYHNLRI